MNTETLRSVIFGRPQTFYHTPGQYWKRVERTRQELEQSAASIQPIPVYDAIPYVEKNGSGGKPVSENLGEKKLRGEFLYKGLQPSAFRYYFAHDGITPSRTDKDSPWITSDIGRALEHANIDPVSGHRTCLAVVTMDVLQRDNLKRSRTAASLLSGNYYDYYGNEHIAWSDLRALLLTDTSANEVYHYSEEQEMTQHWEQLDPKIVLVEPGSTTEVLTKISNLL
jgi:hypothetical protein